MNILIDKFNQIAFKLEFPKQEFTEEEKQVSAYEYWLPFKMLFKTDTELYEYKDRQQAFTRYELESFTENLKKIIKDKSDFKEIEDYEFTNMDTTFDMKFYETYEKDEVYIDFWINLGNYYPNKEISYDKGYRFIVTIETLNNFTKSLDAYLCKLI